jgi:hypothetical protein
MISAERYLEGGYIVGLFCKSMMVKPHKDSSLNKWHVLHIAPQKFNVRHRSSILNSYWVELLEIVNDVDCIALFATQNQWDW